MVVVAPNSVQLLKYVRRYVGPKERLDRRISQAVTRLKAKGMIGKDNSLTKSGLRFVESLESFGHRRPLVQKHWDEKWRIIIFDVWERRRHIRNKLRRILKSIGFVKIQDSVWAYPYPCEELLVFLRTDLHLGSGILYIVADEIEHDRKLREHFGLQSS